MTRLFEALSPERAAKGLYWDRAWSLVQGCTPVSAACDHCWAASQAHMRASNPNAKVAAANAGLTVLSGDRKGAFNGHVRFNADALDIPCRTRKPQVWAVWTDLFHEQVREQDIRYAIEDMHEAAHHTFIVLTKRPERMAQFDMRGPNIIVGVTAENQATANERIPHLLATEATWRMISGEPMLGPVDLAYAAFNGADSFGQMEGIHWVVCVGETGPSARPMHPEWARSLRDQCQAAGVPFWLKSHGEWALFRSTWRSTQPNTSKGRVFGGQFDGEELTAKLEHGASFARVGKTRAGALLDGKLWRETP